MCLPAIFYAQCLCQQFLVSEHNTWVVPHCELVVLDSTQDVSSIVPRHTMKHATYRTEYRRNYCIHMLAAQKQKQKRNKRTSSNIFSGEFPPPCLTNFADFGFSSKMAHGGQVKVAILVYQGDFPVGGWATLIKSYLQHLQLHVNAHKRKQINR